LPKLSFAVPIVKQGTSDVPMALYAGWTNGSASQYEIDLGRGMEGTVNGVFLNLSSKTLPVTNQIDGIYLVRCNLTGSASSTPSTYKGRSSILVPGGGSLPYPFNPGGCANPVWNSDDFVGYASQSWRPVNADGSYKYTNWSLSEEKNEEYFAFTQSHDKISNATTTDGIELNPDYDYALIIRFQDANALIWGASTTTEDYWSATLSGVQYPQVAYSRGLYTAYFQPYLYQVNRNPDTNIEVDPYFLLYESGFESGNPGGGLGGAGVGSKIIGINNPQFNTGATTSPVWISFDYYAYQGSNEPELYNIVGFEIENLQDGTFGVYESVISGYNQVHSLGQYVTLPTDSIYSFTPYLSSTAYPSGQNYIYNSYNINPRSITFVVGSVSTSTYDAVVNGTGIMPLTLFDDQGNVIAGRASSTIFESFLNVPNFLLNRFPLSYINQIATLLLSYPDISATSTGSVSYAFASTSAILPGSSIELFSASKVTQLMPTNILSLLRLLMVAITYMGFLFYAFKRVSGLVKHV
jgi:hypothetical protein